MSNDPPDPAELAQRRRTGRWPRDTPPAVAAIDPTAIERDRDAERRRRAADERAREARCFDREWWQ